VAPDWIDLGPADELSRSTLRPVTVQHTAIALSFEDGQFGAVSNACNHAGGPLGEGRLEGAYIVCPWHYWKFHCRTGEGEPGFEQDRVPSYPVRVESGRVYVNLRASTPRSKAPHDPHPLERPVVRGPGPLRVVGISTTIMDVEHPRFSTSDELLAASLGHAKDGLGAETRLIRLRDLSFRACEGFYSKSARACTWPCSITQMDAKDQLDQVYEAFVHWADVILVATPIRWGSASAAYYKMVERMNCVQNQITIHDRVLMRNKVAAFIITGGQDNVQAVAGQMLGFFAEVGCVFPQFPYVAHSRGWAAEDMERNVVQVRDSPELHEGARQLVRRACDMARILVESEIETSRIERGGRKAFKL